MVEMVGWLLVGCWLVYVIGIDVYILAVPGLDVAVPRKSPVSPQISSRRWLGSKLWHCTSAPTGVHPAAVSPLSWQSGTCRH